MRAASVLARNAAPETKDLFTLVTYTHGIKDKPAVRYFRAERPPRGQDAMALLPKFPALFSTEAAPIHVVEVCHGCQT